MRPRYEVHAIPKKGKRKPLFVEKPCPVCYGVMTWVGPEVWMCPKHGEPTRP